MNSTIKYIINSVGDAIAITTYLYIVKVYSYQGKFSSIILAKFLQKI